MDNRWPDSRYPPPSYPNPSYLHSSHLLPHAHISSYSHSLYPNASYPASAPAPPAENFIPPQYSSNPNNYPAAVNPFAPHGGYAAAGPTSTTNLPQHAPAAARHVCSGLGDFHYEKGGIGGRGGSYLNHTNKNEFALKEAIRQYGADPSHLPTGSSYLYGYQIPPGPINAQAQLALPRSIPPQSGVQSIKPKKSSSTTTSFHCNVCNIDCNSRQVFTTHKQGKKHKMNLQNLKDSITQKPKTDASAIDSDKKKRNNKKESKIQNPEATQSSSAPNEKAEAVVGSIKEKRENKKNSITQKPETNQQLTGPKEKAEASVPGSSRKKRRNNDAPEEDLETKKRKVLEAGAEPSEVKVCEICNTVANSQKVFESHITGSKHIKKQFLLLYNFTL